MTNHNLTEYRRSQVLSMSQVDLVIMLYQGAIRFLEEGIQLVQTERYDQSWQKFDRARRIVIHLCGTLNKDAGDLTDKFAALYAYVIEQIAIANARRDVAVARDCIDILTTLKEGWEGMASSDRTAMSPPAEDNSVNAPAATAPPMTDSLCLQA